MPKQTSQVEQASPRILRQPTVEERVGVHGVTLWRWERAGQFPKRVKLGPHAVGWIESEVNDWLAQRAEDR